MQTLYLITGPAGVGKSTISKKIAETLEKSALIEGDFIYSQVVGGYEKPWKDGNHLDIFWDICFENIKIYLNHGYDVVFNYIITPNTLENFKNLFRNYRIKFVVLMCDEETILKRDSNRPLDCQMQDRCITLLNSFKNKNFDKNYILDTTLLNIDGVINKIQETENYIIK